MDSKIPVCYNGDIFTAEVYQEFIIDSPQTQAVMCGRGMIANPGLIRELKGMGRMTKEELRDFHDRIWTDYRAVMFGDNNALYKMKEIWLYMSAMFTDSGQYMKRIKKADTRTEYENAVNMLFREQEIVQTTN